jgi:hypothetical protein
MEPQHRNLIGAASFGLALVALQQHFKSRKSVAGCEEGGSGVERRAAIDVGSGSTKMVVADVDVKHFRIVHEVYSVERPISFSLESKAHPEGIDEQVVFEKRKKGAVVVVFVPSHLLWAKRRDLPTSPFLFKTIIGAMSVCSFVLMLCQGMLSERTMEAGLATLKAFVAEAQRLGCDNGAVAAVATEVASCLFCLSASSFIHSPLGPRLEEAAKNDKSKVEAEKSRQIWSQKLRLQKYTTEAFFLTLPRSNTLFD